MMMERNKLPAAILTAICMILLFYALYSVGVNKPEKQDSVIVGYLCDGDESTPYTDNFLRTLDTLRFQYGEKIKVNVKTNVPPSESKEALDDLVCLGCDIIFANSSSYGEYTKKAAGEYPTVQFCQATCSNANTAPCYDNYHTFMGQIYEGRYLTGVIAGSKLSELINTGAISANEALVGYVAAYPNPEIISGYTAFMLGIRSQCPSAKMIVSYINSWSDYELEKECAEKLIEKGCIIISQHSDTIGVAVACEASRSEHPVFNIGYNQDLTNVAPDTTIVSTRIDWSPYISSAIEAVFAGEAIESHVKGNIHGNDIGAGFDQGWVEIIGLNRSIPPKNSDSIIEETTDALKKGSCHVFLGDYIGINPKDQNDTWDLNIEYHENKDSSAPNFHYILRDVIMIDEE